MEKVIMFSHRDLDGVGCAILAKSIFDDVEVEYCDYKNINQKVEEAIDKDGFILITDISVNEDVAKKLDKRGNVQLLDHHDVEWLNKYSWAFIDKNDCGTALTFDYLLYNQYDSVQKFNNLVKYINIYDNYKVDFKEEFEVGKTLNNFMQVVGFEAFVQKFLNSPVVEFNSFEQAIINNFEYKKKIFIDSVINNKVYTVHKDLKNKTEYALVLMSSQYSYVNDLAHTLMDKIEEISYVIVIDITELVGSIRGKGDVDVGQLARKLGGGGRTKTAGFPITPNKVNTILEEGNLVYRNMLINSYFKEVNHESSN